MALRTTCTRMIFTSIFLFPVLGLTSYFFVSLIYKQEKISEAIPYYGDCISTMTVTSSTIDDTYDIKKDELGEDHFLVSNGFFIDINKLRNYTFNNNRLCANVLHDFLDIEISNATGNYYAKLYQEKLKYIQRTEGFPFKRISKGEFTCVKFDDGRTFC